MFLAFCAVLLVASVPLCGGSLARLAGLRLRLTGLLTGALAVQILVTTWTFGLPSAVLSGLHLASYAMAAGMVWANRRIPGILVLWGGASLNLLCIALNHGELPARAAAMRAAGLADRGGFENSGHVAHPRLAWLGDTMATPSWLPFRNVISVGDLVILVGAAVLLHTVCRSRLARAAGVDQAVAGRAPTGVGA